MSRGKKHEYMDMYLDYSTPDKVVFSMKKYTRNVIAEFPEDLGKIAENPAAEYISTVCDDTTRRPFPKEQAQVFHWAVAQLLFLVISSW